jgi:hypothetical protein
MRRATGDRHQHRWIDIHVRLLGAYHDGHIELTYRNVPPIALWHLTFEATEIGSEMKYGSPTKGWRSTRSALRQVADGRSSAKTSSTDWILLP